MAGAIRRLDSLATSNPQSFPKMPPETDLTAGLLLLINDWFDIFNTTKPIMNSRSTKKAFGYPNAFKEQSEVLEVLDTIQNMRAPGREELLPFQNGRIQNIRGLFLLLEHLKLISNGAIEYTMTDRINRDCLERMFGYLRSNCSGLHDHPSPFQFKYRLRSSILVE